MKIPATVGLISWLAGSLLSFYGGQWIASSSVLRRNSMTSSALEFLDNILAAVAGRAAKPKSDDGGYTISRNDDSSFDIDSLGPYHCGDAASSVAAEMLVHPGLFAHPHPKTIAVVLDGGSDLSPNCVIQEISKHSSVESVWILSRRSNSNDDDDDDDDDDDGTSIVEDSPVVTMFTNDIESFYGSLSFSGEVLDVFLYDDSKLDYQVDSLYCDNSDGSSDDDDKESSWWDYLAKRKFGYNDDEDDDEDDEDDDHDHDVDSCDAGILSDNSILVAYLGPTYPQQRSRRSSLVDSGFDKILDFDVPLTISRTYEDDSHGKTIVRRRRYVEPMPYAVAFMNDEMVSRWHMTEAHWNIEIKNRLKVSEQVDDEEGRTNYDSSSTTNTVEAKPRNYRSPFIAFDSLTMVQSEYPPRRRVDEFCTFERGPHDSDCSEYMLEDTNKANESVVEIPLEQLDVRQSSQGEHSGRGVFAKVPIPAGAILGVRATAFGVEMGWKSFEMVSDLSENFELYDDASEILDFYFDGYGVIAERWGRPTYWVDSGILAFVNHGCNKTYNAGLELPFSESSFALDEDAEYPSIDIENVKWFVDDDDEDDDEEKSSVYDPLADRDQSSGGIEGKDITKIIKDLEPGDEILDNYIGFGGLKYLNETVIGLRADCAGGLGLVEQYYKED